LRHTLLAGITCGAASLAIAACGGSSSGSSPGAPGGGGGGGSAASGGSGKGPIVIGASISQTGDFSSDGNFVKQAYQLWADQVNSQGGLLGRKVEMKFVNDASSTQQVVTNYQTLISSDHVNLVFGPFSSLLTIPSSEIASRYGYAFVEPAGGSQEVFTRGLHNVFEAEPQAGYKDMTVFGHWLLSLPAGQRPKTAAYVSEQDPFIGPEVEALKNVLQAGGVKTVYNQTYPIENPDYSPLALAIANTKADVAALGVNIPDGTAFTRDFIQQDYNPKAIIYANGPDQGTTWISKVGQNNLNGMTAPIAWLPQLNTYGNKQMVAGYLKKYGGNAAGMSGDVAEAYSVGQVIQQAAEAAHSVSNAALIKALHSMTFKTVQGNFAFNKLGEPTGSLFLGQWVNHKWVRVYPPAAAQAKPIYPKPAWGQG
jgi:branched-chain amino acid transport system substrate-binding protein